MRTDLISEPGDPARSNEDFAALALPASGQGGALVVLDGVTPPQGDDGCLHSVPWFCSRLGGALTELSVSRRDLTLTEILSHAILRTADSHAATCDLSHTAHPSGNRGPRPLVRVGGGVSGPLRLGTSGRDDRRHGHRPAGRPAGPGPARQSGDGGDRGRHGPQQGGGLLHRGGGPSVAARAVTGELPRTAVRTLTASPTARPRGRRSSAGATGPICWRWCAGRGRRHSWSGYGRWRPAIARSGRIWAAARRTTTRRWCTWSCEGRRPAVYFSMLRFNWLSRRASSATSRRSQWDSSRTYRARRASRTLPTRLRPSSVRWTSHARPSAGPAHARPGPVPPGPATDGTWWPATPI